MDPCKYREEQLSAFLDGELSGEERQELLEHLSGCDACQNYLADLTAIGEALEPVPAPEGFAQSVMERVSRTRRAKRSRTVRWQRWGLLAACCALALLGMWRSYPQRGQDAASPAAGARSAMERTEDAPAEDIPSPQADVAECSVDPEEPSDGEAAEAYSMDAKTAPAYSSPAELLDCETASELFGHPLVPCTADNFEGYSLNWVGDGQDGDLICTSAVYQFANGTASVRDQDREGHIPLADDYESVVYEGETFYVRDAQHGGGRPVVVYLPNGETGLSYNARFDADINQDEVFDLLLSLRIT